MEAKLICLDGLRVSGEIPLAKFPVAVGRNPGADLQLEDASVSRFHCVIDEVDGGLVVRDLGSRQGTLVNGLKVGVSPLMSGDDLAIGGRNFRAVYLPCESEETSPQPCESEHPSARVRRSENRTRPARRRREALRSWSKTGAKGIRILATWWTALGTAMFHSLQSLPHFARQHS